MAISILENNGCPHKYHYELESLFYTLIWMCLTASEQKADGHPLPIMKFRDMQLQHWCGPELDDPGKEAAVFQHIAAIKAAALMTPDKFESRILSQLPPYFTPIREMLEELRDLLFRPVTRKDIHLTREQMRVQDRKAEEVFPAFINIFDKTLKKLELADIDHANDSANEQPTENIAHDPDMERAAHRRALGRGKKSAISEENLADQAEPESHGDNDSEGDRVSDSPTPRPAKGPHHVDSLVLDRQSRNFASRTAVSRAASPPMSEASKTAISLKVVSLADKGDIATSGGSRDHGISPGSGSRSSGSRDTSFVRSKRAAPEPGQSHSSSKRRRNQ